MIFCLFLFFVAGVFSFSKRMVEVARKFFYATENLFLSSRARKNHFLNYGANEKVCLRRLF